MEELEAAGVCIFCPEHVGAYQREPVEHSGEHWYVKRNDFPYAGTRAHYLIVPAAPRRLLRRAARTRPARSCGRSSAA